MRSLKKDLKIRTDMEEMNNLAATVGEAMGKVLEDCFLKTIAMYGVNVEDVSLYTENVTDWNEKQQYVLTYDGEVLGSFYTWIDQIQEPAGVRYSCKCEYEPRKIKN